ncbi:hypothetical protein F5B20DRAFT_591445, partial [Whalleya microplaca]
DSDLYEAINCGKIAAECTSERSRQAYSILGVLYRTKWEMVGRHIEDLENAVVNCQKSVGLGRPTAARLVNLAIWVLELFKVGGKTASKEHANMINEAIDLAEAAFAVTQATPWHQHRDKIVLTIARARYVRSRTGHEHGGGYDADPAHVKILLEATMLSPGDRVEVALSLAMIARDECNWEDVHKAMEAAVQLQPLLSPRYTVQRDQQPWQMGYAGLASGAAAAALMANRKAEEVLQLVESGRCIISGHRFERLADISRLRSTRHDLADRFENLCRSLDRDGKQSVAIENIGVDLSLRHRADTDLA